MAEGLAAYPTASDRQPHGTLFATTVPRAIAIWRATMQCQSCRSVSSAVKDFAKSAPDNGRAIPTIYPLLTVTSAYVATDGYMDWWQVFPSNYDVQSENDPPAWFLYIVEGDKLWEVDLRQRLPQVIFEKQGLISLSMLNALQSTVQKASTPSAANNSWQRSLFRTVADDSYSDRARRRI